MSLPDSSAVPASYEWRDAVHLLPGGLDLHFGSRVEPVEVAYRLAGDAVEPASDALEEDPVNGTNHEV